MSVQRVKTVKKSQKDQGTCGKCGVALPKGTPYIWWSAGFRTRGKYVRCTKPACYPKPSERETTSKSMVYAAVEDFEAREFESVEDVASAVEEVAEAFREYADEKREAADAWENGNYQFEEWADMAEQAADTIEDWQPEADEFNLDDIRDEYDGEYLVDDEGDVLDDDGNQVPADQAEFDQWAAEREAEFITEQVDAAREAIADAEGELG